MARPPGLRPRHHRQPGHLAELRVKRSDSSFRELPRRPHQRRIRETQRRCALLPAKTLYRLQEQIRTRNEIELSRLQKDLTHSDRKFQSAPDQQHGCYFQEDVLQEQPAAPLSGQEPPHHLSGRRMMHIPLIVVGNQETVPRGELNPGIVFRGNLPVY